MKKHLSFIFLLEMWFRKDEQPEYAPALPNIKKPPNTQMWGAFLCMAEEVGFEPTKGYKPLPV